MTIKYTETHPPASAKSISDVIHALGVDKDAWVVRFWARYNGALLNDKVLIYSVSDIVERNQTYEIDNNFPRLVLIGDDSGGRLVLIGKAMPETFYLIDSGDPFLEDADVFYSIEELVDYISGGHESLQEKINIVAVANGKPTPQEVLAIKKGLGLSFSIADMKAKLEKKNEIILPDVKSVKYESIVTTYSHLLRFESC